MKDPIELIERDDLTPDLQLIADVCGMEVVKIMLRTLQGLNIYIPKISRFYRFIYRYYKMNIHKTLKQIASELTVSEQYLKNITKKK